MRRQTMEHKIQQQMSLKRITQISDRQLRNVLISTAENIENMLKSGKIGLDTPLVSIQPHGLRVDVSVEHKGDNKPILFTFTYSVDVAQMKRWMIENAYLCEGPLSYVARGIEVVTIGPDKADKSGFSIDGTDGERIFLPLLDGPVIFRLHRDLFGGREWECYYEDQQ
jgi:hypothetical protein